MKKILISLAALSLVLTACGGVSKVEKKVVKEFDKLGKDYDAEFLMISQMKEDKIEQIQEYRAYTDSDDFEFTYRVGYSLFSEDGEYLINIYITDFIDEVDEDDYEQTICIIDNTLLTYLENYDSDFDGKKEAKATFKEVCSDLDGEYIKGE